MVAKLPSDRERRLEEPRRCLEIALFSGEHPGAVQRLRAEQWIGVGACIERRGKQPSSLVEMSVQLPEPPQRNAEAQAHRAIASLARERLCSTQVVVFELELRQPHRLLLADSRCLGKL